MAQRFDGAALRRRRERTGKSRTKLAAAVDRGERVLARYEEGLTVPPTRVIEAMAAELGCNVADFFVDVPPVRLPHPEDLDPEVADAVAEILKRGRRASRQSARQATK